MSRISHFQRFSQRENHVTNNTLLILRHFYQSSPSKLQKVLTSLLDSEISLGLTFEQQIKSAHSVPDALIMQERLRIFIETKRGSELDEKQIYSHLRSIHEHLQTGEQSILLGITREPISPQQNLTLRREADSLGIVFSAVTFSGIVEALRSQCAEFEEGLGDMIDDFEEFLAEENLLEISNKRLPVFPCGLSFAENKQFNLYYEPPSRPCKLNYQFIGIYTEKQVRLVGAVVAIAVCKYEDGDVTVLEEEKGHLTGEQRMDIKTVMEETRYYDLKADAHRVYFVDQFVPTTLKKTSPGGMIGLRYLDIATIAGSTFNPRQDYTSQELANLLEGRTFE